VFFFLAHDIIVTLIFRETNGEKELSIINLTCRLSFFLVLELKSSSKENRKTKDSGLR
jgi:hypothetical protein